MSNKYLIFRNENLYVIGGRIIASDESDVDSRRTDQHGVIQIRHDSPPHHRKQHHNHQTEKP